MSPALASSTGIAVVSLVSIVGGYVICAVLWYVMVKRPSGDETDTTRERDSRE